MMRFVGIGLLVFGLVLSGGTAADARRYHRTRIPASKPCERNGVSYPVGDYCNTSCAPNAACEVLVCFTGDDRRRMGEHRRLQGARLPQSLLTAAADGGGAARRPR